MDLPSVSVVVLTWNSMAHVAGCLGTMMDQSYQNYHILVVDSNSSDNTVQFIRSHFPQVQVLSLDENLGYRKGNALGMRMAEGDYVVICNHDVEVERNWLAEMVQAMQENDAIGLVTPMILLADHPDRITGAGNTLHFSGMCGPRAKNEPRQQHESRQVLAAVSGCCFMIRRDLMLRLGGFSTDFDQLDVGWHASFEDVDLSWRAQMLGYRVEYIPTAVMYHKYKQPDLFPSRFASYEWGRYLTVCRNYSLLGLVMIAPFLVVLEFMAWVYAIAKGRDHVVAKARIMAWLLKHPGNVWAMRRRVQAMRSTPDSEIVSRMSPKLSLYQQLGGGKVAQVIDVFFRLISCLYYWIFLSFLRMRDSF